MQFLWQVSINSGGYYSHLSSIDVAGEPLSKPFVPGDHAHQAHTQIITDLDIGNVDPLALAATFNNLLLDTSLHSVSTLVLLEYAATTPGVGDSWKMASEYFWPVLYDGNFAGQIGMSAIPGRYNTDPEDPDLHDYSTILRTILGYSAINVGPDDINARPFGDTGIVSLYHDADILGAVAGATGVSSEIANHAMDIS